jgi:glycosyltransferase involved in cell wall biosynthesis
LNRLNEQDKIIGLLSFWFGECAWIGKTFADQHGKKHFCWLMGQDARNTNPYPNRVRLQPPDLIALSDFLQTEFASNHGTIPGKVITPGVEVSLFDYPASSKDIDILAVGSLISLKNYSLFLEIISRLRTKKPYLSVMVVGDGPEKKNLLKKALKLGLNDTIQFTGSLPYMEVLNKMKHSMLLVHTSSFEGYSGVCMEALASGCHVISFCKPMNYDISGWTTVSSVDSMEKEILRLLEHNQRSPLNMEQFDIRNTVQEITGMFLQEQT